MTTAQWIVFSALVGTMIYCFFEISSSLNPRKQIQGMLSLALMMLTVLISLFLVFISVDANEKLSQENKAKCPEYVPIQNVYILKK